MSLNHLEAISLDREPREGLARGVGQDITRRNFRDILTGNPRLSRWLGDFGR